MGNQPDAQGEMYGGPLKNENPPPLDDVAQYTVPVGTNYNPIEDMAKASNPGAISAAGQAYLDFSTSLASSGEGDLLGFLQKVSTDIDNAWKGGGAPDAQLQMSMLWQSAKELMDTATGLGTVVKAHGDNNVKPFHDYFNGDGYSNDQSVQVDAATRQAGGSPQGNGVMANGQTAAQISHQVATQVSQAKLKEYLPTIYNTDAANVNTYDALPGYMTLTLPPNTLPPQPATKPTDPAFNDKGPGADTKPPGPGDSKTNPAGPGLPKNPYIPGPGGSTAPGTPKIPTSPTIPTSPGTNPTIPPLGTDPSKLAKVPPGTTTPPPNTINPITPPPGTAPPGTTPPGTTPPGTNPPGTNTPIPPVLTPPNENLPGQNGVKVPKLPNEKFPSENPPTGPKLPGDSGSIGAPGGTGPGASGGSGDNSIGADSGMASPAQDGAFAEDAAAMGRSAALASAGGMGNGMMPMMPMGGMGGGSPSGQDGNNGWLQREDEDIWFDGIEAVPSVIDHNRSV